jgi:hypothetical protein
MVDSLLAPPLPAWSRPKGPIVQELDAAFHAGATLAALDFCVRADVSFGGLWRSRLALKAAAAQQLLAGRRMSEAELRDSVALRSLEAEASDPAGGVLDAWRLMGKGSTASRLDVIDQVAVRFGLNLGEELGAITRVATDALAEERPALAAVEDVVAQIRRHHPRAEFLGFWLADVVLAHKLRWPTPLPLLSIGLAQPGSRASEHGRMRGEYPRMSVAYSHAAVVAVDLHRELARRATALAAAAPRLRAKGAEAVVAALLDEDAIAAATRIAGMSDRGMRRLCDRLVALGAARELTGRPSFRLYGL